jgi:hypothetical protein
MPGLTLLGKALQKGVHSAETANIF